MDVQSKNILIDKVLNRYKLYKNKGRFGRFIKTPIRTFIFYVMVFFAYIKPYRIYSKTLWNQKITYFLPEANHIHFYGYFEVNLTNFFIKILKPGDTFLDVGAHVGYYSMLASFLVEKEGKVYSLEPTPRTFNSLLLNSEMAQNKNIYPYNLAALDKKSTIDFLDYGPKYSAFNTFQNRPKKGFEFLHKSEKHIAVATTDLDSFCQDNNIIPNFIKIDAEGSEYLILNGMKMILSSSRPIISVEVSLDKEWEKNRIYTFKIFLEAKYKLFEITLEGNLKLLSGSITKYDNLIAVPEEKISLLGDLIVVE